MRSRLESCFDHFIDVDKLDDKKVVELAKEMEIDIAVDLSGHTAHSRPGIFALRAAPIQVNYLGYPGTIGTEHMDYLLADKIIIPESSQLHYAEKIVYLPNSFMVRDTSQRVSEQVFDRATFGLPDSVVVFCCFNSTYKFNPVIFNCWMQILGRVEGSVLWLPESNPTANDNIRKAALHSGISADRVIFAQRMPLPEDHLARLRLADLFLDTLPYNAHTTANDALWAGLPVLTCLGDSFAGRVAASLLTAIDLPELITTTLEDYVALAIALALDPQKLAKIKVKLAKNRFTTPLFDTQRFTKHIETAYGQMYQRYRADLPPETIYIQN
jgi:predicted O-linked N-acetylglucosamine transferase (SPINDLY family)